MKRYREYKDSGVEWIGEIPSHWNVKRNKYIYKLSKGKNPTELTDTMNEDELPYLSMEYLRTGQNEQYSKINTNYVVVEDNELLLLCDGSNSGEFIISRKGIVSSTMAKVINISNVENRYSKYMFKVYEPILKENTVGMGIPHVNTSFFRDSLTLIPTREEQNKIANYLDKKTSQIETLISKKEELIEILKFSRNKVILETVTKGLEKDVPLKDSGVGWIGEIPSHWEVKKLDYISDTTKLAGFEFTEYFNYIDNGEIIALRGVNLKNGKLDLNNIVKIDRSVSNKLRRSKLYKDDLLMSYAGSVGMVAVVDEDNKYHLAPNVAKISIYDLNPNYYCYVMLSDIGQIEIDLLKNKNAQESISMENIRKIRVPVCSKEEQANIVEYLDKKTLEIDSLIYKIREQIELLKKAKQKLITEVVTGKIDVTNL